MVEISPAILGHGQAVVMAAEDARQRWETLHQRQQTVAVFAGDRVHLRIAQRQRRVVHKDRCRFVAALEQLGLQPADGLVGQPAFDVPARLESINSRRVAKSSTA
nr:Uncharacterised protein [Klebsiella pneumoniae]